MERQTALTKSTTWTKFNRKLLGVHHPVKKQTFFFICLLGMVVFVVFYILVIQDLQQKTEALEAENKVLYENVKSWRIYSLNEPQYKHENEKMQSAIETGMAVYPSDIREEDILMLAVDLQENCGVSISNINLSSEQTIYSVDASVVRDTKIEGMEENIDWKKKQVSIVFSGNYSQMKECIARIYAQKNKTAIENITLSKSESYDQLVGSLDLNVYEMTGTGREYVTPDITPYIQGTQNIFGFVSVNGEKNENREELEQQ